ncbi:unnamed protein product [Xylocopa violacea]|uniref:Uncharacterized protein n=1 Tax=Xylocopa violacea TaxID=135666 RepID=A0ABP1NBZ1_XYLVO
MTSLPGIGKILGNSRILGNDVIFQEVAHYGYLLTYHVLLIQSRKIGFSTEKLDFVSGEHDMRGGIPMCHFLEMTSSVIPGISAILGNDVIFLEIPVSGAHSSVKPDFWDFVLGEHDMRGGIPNATSWKMTSSVIPGISAILGNDVIFLEIPVYGAHSSVKLDFRDFVLGEHDMRGGIPNATSWKMTSFPGILEFPRILAIPRSDVIFQEIPVFRTHSSVKLRFSDFVLGEHDM